MIEISAQKDIGLLLSPLRFSYHLTALQRRSGWSSHDFMHYHIAHYTAYRRGGIADIIFDKKTSFPPSTRCHYGCISYGVSGEMQNKVFLVYALLPSLTKNVIPPFNMLSLWLYQLWRS